MPRFMDYMNSVPIHGRLQLQWQNPQHTEVFYVPSDAAVEAMEGARIPNRMKLLDIVRSERRLTIHPINTRWKIDTFLKPKYAQIRKLTLTGQHFVDLPYNPHGAPTDENGLPTPEDEVMMLLEDLPSSFIKDYEYGLGFSGDFKLLIGNYSPVTPNPY